MSNDELKKKIAIICARGYDEWVEEDYARRIEKIDFDKLADTLIAAGIGDTKNLELKCNLMERVIYNFEKKLVEFEQAEHRAEVAERALKNACEDIISTTDFLCKLEKTGGVVTVKNYSPDNANAEAYLKRA